MKNDNADADTCKLEELRGRGVDTPTDAGNTAVDGANGSNPRARGSNSGATGSNSHARRRERLAARARRLERKPPPFVVEDRSATTMPVVVALIGTSGEVYIVDLLAPEGTPSSLLVDHARRAALSAEVRVPS